MTRPSSPSAEDAFALLDWKANLLRSGLPPATAWRHAGEIRRFLRRCELLRVPVEARCAAPYVRLLPARAARAAAAEALRWFFDPRRNPAAVAEPGPDRVKVPAAPAGAR